MKAAKLRYISIGEGRL